MTDDLANRLGIYSKGQSHIDPEILINKYMTLYKWNDSLTLCITIYPICRKCWWKNVLITETNHPICCIQFYLPFCFQGNWSCHLCIEEFHGGKKPAGMNWSTSGPEFKFWQWNEEHTTKNQTPYSRNLIQNL